LIKLFLVFVSLYTYLNADKILNKALACPSVMALKKAPLGDDYLNLNMYAISNSCIIIYKNTEVQAIGYDPRNSSEIYQKIVEKRTGVTLFVKKSVIQIEQGGKKSTWRF